MDFEQMALTRQSTRNYDATKDVELEKLVRICEVGMLAPSACNSQPWKLHIVTKNSSNIEALRKSVQVVGLNRFVSDVNSFIVIEQVFGNASAHMGSKMGKNDLNSMDIGILASYLCLQAMDLGLATCIIGAFKKEVMQEVMNFNEDQVVRLVIAVGYPKEDDPIRKKVRKSKEQVIEIHEN